MNIFIMILVFILMAGYFLIDAPNQRVRDDRIESALRMTEIKSILSCMARAHSGAIELDTTARAGAKEILEPKSEPCTEKYNVQSIKLCADERREVTICKPDRVGQTIGNFIVTTADMPEEKDTNLVLKTLAQDFDAASNFGIIITKNDGSLAILSGNGHRRKIPSSIINAASLEQGRLIYITQYSVSADINLGNPSQTAAENIFCMTGEQKIFRFGKWECLSQNPSALCTGDTIWNSVDEVCEIDPSRRPLCATGQTAVEIEDMWQCIDPSPIRECPDGTTAQLDYVNMEWVCVTKETESSGSKCPSMMIAKGRVLGGTLLKPANLCNDCEKMVTNEETCEVSCVPDETKVNSTACYPGASECRGSSRAFYFGFPDDSTYKQNVRVNIPELAGVSIPVDGTHSQNRKFNCLDCGSVGAIDEQLSMPPFVAVCE